MPKQKTHKGLKCRVRVTRNGKVVRRKAGKSHLMSHKSGKRRRQLRQQTAASGTYAKTIKRELAGG
ncbi:MAG: 50S ribosomal protein L35 [Candidatus Brocadiae bacterium]|nr:50S ribosomal protein L35 [Candidatus Brocadiia bacterium]